MDDSDYVCPLCCEELDISDREFYPCKCGYQVCMWCWHRIRESESGLCPACRTPYGEDPHQFSAVDVEEVLRANKEKEAAAKRERQKQVVASGSDGNSDDGLSNAEVPKDRTSLANMRVIRRNLVYAVGLPPHIATEEILRKPEYFGQYGKIAKIVLNRTQTATADPRRASASAYVTFVHKEDTLACILALDGFYLENRNIRASYGTSKYCSAFIKNVRCSNPECTYLHEMGAAEDTFTKQEIQAGYVTSGRDVLARQQQILAELIRLGNHASLPRKRIGAGGPSGTGKAATNPAFPPPEYDEPAKPAASLVPTPVGITRATTVAAPSLNPANIAAKLGRSSSVGTKSPTLTSVSASTPQRKSISASAATAASVVAGVHSFASRPEPLDVHTTLTPLTPLKRTVKANTKVISAPLLPEDKPSVPGKTAANGKKSSAVPRCGLLPNSNGAIFTVSASTPQTQSLPPSESSSVSSIGGDVIGPPAHSRESVLSELGGEMVGSLALESVSALGDNEPCIHSSVLGGEVFTGQLPHSGRSVIGSEKDKWNSSQVGGSVLASGSVIGGVPVSSNSMLWNGLRPPSAGPVGGGTIGSQFPTAPANSSSALASILGISLPTGSGSLRESTSLWTSSFSFASPSPLSTLNGSALPSQEPIIGGVPLHASVGGGAGAVVGPGTIGIGGSPTSSKSDVALLQSLLPGVHITSGPDSLGLGTVGSRSGWNAAVGTRSNYGSGSLGGDTIGGWGGGLHAASGTSIGAIGHSTGQPPQRRQGPGIW